MPRQIIVRPLAMGWTVELDQLDGPMVFRRLAHRLAVAGEGADLVIHLRDGSLAGRFSHPAATRPSKDAPPGDQQA